MLTKKELKKLSEITEVKVIWKGKNRKRSRIASVIFEDGIGITIRSKKQIYFCLRGYNSLKWRKGWDVERNKLDFDYYGRCILNGVVNMTIDTPHESPGIYSDAITESACAFS